MHAAVGERLVNCLLDHISRVVFMQLQNTDKFLYAPSFRPFLLQNFKHLGIGLRPLFPPFLNRFGVVKGTWPLLKKREIMQRIENILLFAIASGMACKLVSFFIKDVNEKRIRFECHLTAGFGNWHRVAVGFIHGLTVWIKPNCYQFTAVIIKRRQWVKQGLLLFPCLTNRHRLPVDMPFIILHTSLKKQLVQLLKRCSFGKRHQIVSASKPNPAFYLPFLPTGARRAEMGLK